MMDSAAPGKFFYFFIENKENTTFFANFFFFKDSSYRGLMEVMSDQLLIFIALLNLHLILQASLVSFSVVLQKRWSFPPTESYFSNINNLRCLVFHKVRQEGSEFCYLRSQSRENYMDCLFSLNSKSCYPDSRSRRDL